jgi:Bacterial Ig domain
MNGQIITWTRIERFAAVLVLGILVSILCGPSCHKKIPPGGQIHGFVVALIREAKENKGLTTIHLPDARVYLKRLPAGTVVSGSEAITNPHGFFVIPKQQGGQYQICAEANGFAGQCDPTPIMLSRTVVMTHDLQLVPSSPGAIVGRALLKNGSICFHENAAFATLTTTKVSVTDGSANLVSGPITANSYGQFVVPKIPGPGGYRLSGECAQGKGEKQISVNAADLVGATSFALTLDNSAPTVLSIVPSISGTAVRRTSPGATLQVTANASDPDGDTLHYAWVSATPGFVSVDSPTVTWNLPNVAATNAIYVQVTDGRGGYANQQLVVPAGISGVFFSGTVLDRQSHAPVPGAQVILGGATTTTNPVGAFLLSVPETERYVLNVTKAGYGLSSQVFLDGTTGVQVFLDKAFRNVFDGREGGRGVYEGKNSSATVIIKPSSLVDKAGNQATGPINIDVLAYDIDQRNPIPGDFSGKDLNGNRVRLETYGAMDVELSDAGGTPIHLASGATADIAIGIPPAFQAAAPQSIPLLSYDRKAGYWVEEGKFKRIGNRYEATVRHLSTFNADTVFTNTACIRMTAADETPTAAPLNPARFAPAFPFSLHIDYTAGGGPRHNDFQVPDEKASVLYRLPPNTDVTLGIVTTAGPSRTFTVNSGNAVPDNILDQNGVPPYDYGACHGFDSNNPLPGNPVILAVELPPHDAPYFHLPGPGSNAEAIAYYKSVGALDNAGNPTAARGTFSAWKNTNHFSADPLNPNTVGGEIRGIYFNNGDLQLGRDMHCIPINGGPDAACYVTNFGFSVFGGPQGQPDGAIHDAIHNGAPLASVAMEYRAADAPNAVKFFVFANNDALLNAVALDSEGPKNVPHLCLACHGGTFHNNNAENALFLPFDVFSFLYDQVEGNTLAAQQESFRKLNNLVKQTNPTGNAIQGLIDGLYPCGVGTANCAAVDTPFTPGGWGTNPQLYQTVTRNYCRTCHVAQPSVDWTQASQWGSYLQSYVCNDPRQMPHGEVPYKKFWLTQSPHGPTFMAGPPTPPGLGFSSTCPP